MASRRVGLASRLRVAFGVSIIKVASDTRGSVCNGGNSARYASERANGQVLTRNDSKMTEQSGVQHNE